MANAGFINVRLTICLMSVDELCYLITDEPICKDEMPGILQQLLAEKKGLA